MSTVIRPLYKVLYLWSLTGYRGVRLTLCVVTGTLPVKEKKGFIVNNTETNSSTHKLRIIMMGPIFKRPRL